MRVNTKDVEDYAFQKHTIIWRANAREGTKIRVENLHRPEAKFTKVFSALRAQRTLPSRPVHALSLLADFHLST